MNLRGSHETVIDDVHENGIQILPIHFAHTVQQNRLPLHHRDPFDRIIISQAILENMHLVSKDAVFDIYLKELSVGRV